VIPQLTPEEIRKLFEQAREFNDLFEAFEAALAQRICDMELYRQLFWNNTLTPDEVCMFGEKLAAEFPELSFDVYMWLANVFNVTYAMYDNYDLAFRYYKKAAVARPASSDPYLRISECYEPDLNIPPLDAIIHFLKTGVPRIDEPKPVFEKLAHFYELGGNDEMSSYFRRRAEESSPPSAPESLPPR
jgi:tetratricopeptide (TPR) repeat protein